MGLLRRLRSAWQRHGALGFVRLVQHNIHHYAKELFSGRLFRPADVQESEFDDTLGTDTELIREIGSLEVHSDNARHAVRYQPSPHELATKIIHSLQIDHRRFSFVDFGAGKGRVLLIAAQLPFSAVLGVEFSQELCAIANANIDRQAPESLKAEQVECLHADVTAYELPDTPLVCYFYNPFDQVVMASVVERLLASFHERRRDVYVLYVHPEHRDLFDRSGAWESVDTGKFHMIYRARIDSE